MIAQLWKTISGGLKRGKDKPRIHMAVFGKHPAWRDFITDAPVESSVMVRLRQSLLYTSIQSCVERGLWRGLPPEHCLVWKTGQISFRFLWKAADSLVVGKLWPSVDAVGRHDYPLVVAVELSAIAWPWDPVLPAIDALQAACSQAENSAKVIKATEKCGRDLRTASASAVSGRPVVGALSGKEMKTLSEMPAFKESPLSLLRIAYAVACNVKDARSSQNKSVIGRLASASFRLPAISAESCDNLLLWLRFMLNGVSPSTEVLAIAPEGQTWVDVIVGNMDAQSIMCIRSNLEATPLTSEIPFEIPDSFAKEFSEFITRCGADGAGERLTLPRLAQ